MAIDIKAFIDAGAHVERKRISCKEGEVCSIQVYFVGRPNKTNVLYIEMEENKTT